MTSPRRRALYPHEFTLMLNAHQKALVEAGARTHGVTMSEYVRALILAETRPSSTELIKTLTEERGRNLQLLAAMNAELDTTTPAMETVCPPADTL